MQEELTLGLREESLPIPMYIAHNYEQTLQFNGKLSA